jgi:hypothetical protein
MDILVGLITPYRKHIIITKTSKGRPRPDPGCSATDDDDDMDILRINDYISRYSAHQISYVKTITGCKTCRGRNIIATVCTV